MQPRLAQSCGRFEGVADTREDIAPGDAAGVACIDGTAEHSKLRRILLLLAFQGSERGAHHFAGVFVASALDLRHHAA